jgi:ribonuclease Z
MMKMEPPTIYVPMENLEDVKRLMQIWMRLDRGRQVAFVEGVEAGDEIDLSREHVVTVFDTVHTVPSRGYLVWERRKKLKDEYVGLPNGKIRDLRLGGVEVSRETRIPLVCYTGDTTPEGLDNNPDAYLAKVLISEISFIRPNHKREKIHKFGHMHLDDYLERSDRFQNELIIAGHFSTRYHANEVHKYLAKKLPPALAAKLRVWC